MLRVRGLLSLLLLFGFIALVVVPNYSLVFSQSPTPEEKKAEVSSFEMFWPIAAGKTRGNAIYPLKLLKEQLRELVIFSNYKKTDYNIVLVEKRIVEAEKLINDADYANAKETLSDARQKRDKVISLLKKVEESGQSNSNLKDRFISSLEKQAALLKFINGKVPENQKSLLNSDLEHIASLLEKLR